MNTQETFKLIADFAHETTGKTKTVRIVRTLDADVTFIEADNLLTEAAYEFLANDLGKAEAESFELIDSTLESIG